MLFLKAMSGQDLPDESPRKHFTMYPVPDDSALSFGQSDVYPQGIRASWFTNKGLQTVELEGNAYVLNAQGKTIASHGAF
ncbi:MAG: hypothetical protein WCA85_25815 [Paraburkholderia sp.]|uniref:hypothetical protein n=1 Tax=Paraburkholderia sp. TaxID=1926495 RepID=UPI003C59EDBA